MKFILTNLQTIQDAKGTVIIIDVLRAFSTVCYLFNNHAKSIIPVETIEQASSLKKEHPDYILVGEKKGKSIDGFDYNNSPAQIENVDFTDKTIIMTTTAGTKGIVNTVNADEIITGSFLNSKATIKHIEQLNPNIVSFVCTDSSFYDNEDYLYASYVRSFLEKKPLDFHKIKTHLRKHPCTYGFLKKPLTKHSRRDFKLCMELDRFDFVVKVNKGANNIFLYKV